MASEEGEGPTISREDEDNLQQQQGDDVQDAENTDAVGDDEDIPAAPPEDGGGEGQGDPLSSVDLYRTKNSTATTPDEALTEIGLLLRAGWTPYGPYASKKGGADLFYMKAPGTKGRVMYTYGKNLDDETINTIYSFTRKSKKNSRPPRASGPRGPKGSLLTRLGNILTRVVQ